MLAGTIVKSKKREVLSFKLALTQSTHSAVRAKISQRSWHIRPAPLVLPSLCSFSSGHQPSIYRQNLKSRWLQHFLRYRHIVKVRDSGAYTLFLIIDL